MRKVDARVFESTDVERSPIAKGESRRAPDRRRAPRAQLEVPVELRVGVEVIEGTSEDISLTGMFVRVPRLLPSGRTVALHFHLPQCSIAVDAIIVRFRTPAKEASGGVGLCFSRLSEEQLDEIEAYCHAMGGTFD
jgi:c-di-GMP-binding flagellar brake protein YcgR